MSTKAAVTLALVAAIIGGAIGAAAVMRNGGSRDTPKKPNRREVTVETNTPGWATLGVTSSEASDPLEVPLVWTDQARVCWDISGDLEQLNIDLFGDETNESFTARREGGDCKYFHPSISHAAAVDCATVSAFETGDVKWALVVQQQMGDSYGLSGINSTRQYNLLTDPCTGEEMDPPPGFVECDDSTYAKKESDCTWAERQFAPYHPVEDPDWTCYPATGRCEHPGGSFVPEGPQEAGSYCDREACYLDS
jgi:hypothetical protein